MSFVNPEELYRCPQCGLSDRVEKASISGRVNAPTLHLAQLRTYASPWSSFWVGIGVLFLIATGATCILSYPLNHGLIPLSTCGTVLFFTAVLSGFIALSVKQVATSRQEEVARANDALQVQNEATQKRFDQDRGVYENKLYYCGRDDVVFILGRPQTCIPASQIEYLYGD